MLNLVSPCGLVSLLLSFCAKVYNNNAIISAVRIVMQTSDQKRVQCLCLHEKGEKNLPTKDCATVGG
jgi:hypothetical protein